MKVILYNYSNASIMVTIEAYFENDMLVIEGYDIGTSVEQVWGDSDYEYSITVQALDVMKLYQLFGIKVHDKKMLLLALQASFNTTTCFSDMCRYLDKNQIPYRGASWA